MMLVWLLAPLAALGRASATLLPGDGKCHEDADYQTVYEGLLDLDAPRFKFVGDLLEVMRTSNTPTRSLLEVGSGPGHLAREFGKTFDDLSLLEPSPAFRASSSQRLDEAKVRYTMVPKMFEDFQCRSEGYNAVVLSHMLYHVDESKRSAFIEKAYDCVAEGGILAIAMVHDGGKQTEFLKNFRFKNATAAEVRRHFEERGLPFKSIVNTMHLTWSMPSLAERFEKAYDAVYFFVVEDALTRADYRAMTAVEAKRFEKKLRDYTWSLMNQTTGAFSLEMLDEYTFVQRPHSPRKEM